jgi:hypothetical protein
VPEVKALGTEVAGFPGKLMTMKVPGDPLAVAKIVKTNVGVIKVMPSQMEALGTQLTGMVSDIKATFGG